MKHHILLFLGIIVGTLLLTFVIVHFFFGAGAFERHFKVSGIYGVCKPNGYDVVCFLDSDAKDGGLSCVPLAQAGGQCH